MDKGSLLVIGYTIEHMYNANEITPKGAKSSYMAFLLRNGGVV